MVSMCDRAVPVLAAVFLSAAVSFAQPICQDQRIKADEPTVFSSFGRDVAIWSDTAVAGEPNLAPTATGRAYVFDYTELTGWVQTQILTPPDGVGGDRFGRAVAIEGDVLAVGANQHVDPRAPGSGAVYVWRRLGTEWVFEQKIIPPVLGASFGRLLAIDSGMGATRLVVSQSSALLHVYGFDGNSWNHEQTLNNPEDPNPGSFGMSAAIDGAVLIVGASFDPSMCGDIEECCFEEDGEVWCESKQFWQCGVVHVYRWNGTEWAMEQTIAPSNPDCMRRFGRSVAVSGNTIVATAMFPAAAHVFEYDESGSWHETTVLTSVSASPVGFGQRPRSTAIQGDLVIVGDDSSAGENIPKAIAFQRLADGSWIERVVLQPEEISLSFFYGQSVRIHNERAIIGAHGEDQQSGAAYIYDLAPKVGDITCDSETGIDDLLILLNSWGPCDNANGTDQLPTSCPADLNGDGVVNVDDLLIILNNWG